MLQWLRQPHSDLASFFLRMGLAAIFVYRGYIKLSQGGGTTWYPKLADGTEVLSETTQLAVAWGEFVCGLALLVGLLSRVSAIGIIVIMVGAIMVETGGRDFVNIEAAAKERPFSVPTGAEYNFAIIIMCAALVVLGSGLLSLDHLIWRRKTEPAKPAAT
jgi:putative oxidoreductase